MYAAPESELISEDNARYDYVAELKAEHRDDQEDHADRAEGFKITAQWVLAGKAIFTVHNDKGEHYTFRVSKKEDENSVRPPVWFINVLAGPDNLNDYQYLGMVVPNTLNVRLTKASRFREDSTIVKVVRWALGKVAAGADFPAGYGINGCGRCGRCGITLTRPEGIDPAGYRFGFGPTCWAKMQGGE